MGKDMWLYKAKRNDRDDDDIRSCMRGTDWASRESAEELIYWRGAEQIRFWFCRHLEGFSEEGNTLVTESDLRKFMDDLSAVVSKHNLAAKLMPLPKSSRFDDAYYNELQQTLYDVQDISDSIDFDTEYLFYNEW